MTLPTSEPGIDWQWATILTATLEKQTSQHSQKPWSGYCMPFNCKEAGKRSLGLTSYFSTTNQLL